MNLQRVKIEKMLYITKIDEKMAFPKQVK